MASADVAGEAHNPLDCLNYSRPQRGAPEILHRRRSRRHNAEVYALARDAFSSVAVCHSGPRRAGPGPISRVGPRALHKGLGLPRGVCLDQVLSAADYWGGEAMTGDARGEYRGLAHRNDAELTAWLAKRPRE